jgi:hypothetical protein
MNHTNTGGPAFPIDTAGWSRKRLSEGMTLRDYFAAKAMQGMLACPVRPQSGADMYARDAYCVADAMLDAMLKERDS